MSLTLGSGPLAGRPAGAFNFDLAAAAPKHRIYFADFLPRVRATIAGATVLDTVRGKLLHETGILPRFYAPLEDFAQPLLERTDHTTHCPFKGDASYWSVAVDGTTRKNAVWAYEEPFGDASWLRGHGSLYHEQADEWWVEDELVVGHLRDPFHRVDALPTSRAVTITAPDGAPLAATTRATLLYETAVPPRVYVPRADVAATVEPTEERGICPYKGEWRAVTVAGIDGAAWTFPYPRPEAAPLAGLLGFDPGKTRIALADR